MPITPATKRAAKLHFQCYQILEANGFDSFSFQKSELKPRNGNGLVSHFVEALRLKGDTIQRLRLAIRGSADEGWIEVRRDGEVKTKLDTPKDLENLLKAK